MKYVKTNKVNFSLNSQCSFCYKTLRVSLERHEKSCIWNSRRAFAL